MNFKVIEYRCGCKYILITDPNKRIFKTGKCPQHWQNQKHIILWCKDCNTRLKVRPQIGHRQKRCSKCAKIHQLEVNRYNWKNKYAGRYKQSGRIQYLGRETDKSKAKRIVDEIFDKLRLKFKPVWGRV